MSAKNANNAATHLAGVMRRDRQAHHWTLREFSNRTKINYTTLSRVETGHRPFFEKLAIACDNQFPERRGWYLQYYEESKSWVPAGFRDWSEHENTATVIRAWSPGFLHGLLQTSDYARAQLETASDASAEMTAARLAARMQRQQRVLHRLDPPSVYFVVDELSLYRRVGSPEIMAAQMRHVLDVARLPHVVLQVLPAVEHPAGASGFVVADNSAYAEHMFGGFVYTESETVTSALRMFGTITSESDKASVSLRKIERMAEIWNGVSQATQMPTAGTASKSATTAASLSVTPRTVTASRSQFPPRHGPRSCPAFARPFLGTGHHAGIGIRAFPPCGTVGMATVSPLRRPPAHRGTFPP
jgi:transcriptional regulator with XRE-family HTH domain